MAETILVVPDSHSAPDQHNRRYDWLGDLIVDIKPTVVVDIGDWWSMDSLCSYDKGTKGFEGRRYKADIEAGIDAQDRMMSIIKKQKKKLPRFVRTLGNHENRINRVIDRDPVLEGTIGTADLMSKEYGWEEHAFLDVVEIAGVHFSHYFTSGVMGRPIGGKNAARAMIMEKGASCVAGHSHLFDYSVQPDINGVNKHGLVVGVFQDYDSKFAGPANKMWRRGVAVLNNVEKGDYDLEWIGLDRLKKAYDGNR